MNDKEFWKCTPRKLHLLFKQHKIANGLEEAEEKEQLEFIDNVIF